MIVICYFLTNIQMLANRCIKLNGVSLLGISLMLTSNDQLICYVGWCGVHCIQKPQRTYYTYWADIWVWWTQERVWEMWRRKIWSWRIISTCLSGEKNNSYGEVAKERTKRRSRETSTLARAIGAHYNFACVDCMSNFCFCFLFLVKYLQKFCFGNWRILFFLGSHRSNPDSSKVEQVFF